MSDSRRRSSRRSKRRSFCVGDVVEIVSKGDKERVVAKGHLLSKLSEDSSGGRWMVGYDEKSWPSEEMSESSFGEVVGKVDIHSSPSAGHPPPRSRRNSNASIGNLQSKERKSSQRKRETPHRSEGFKTRTSSSGQEESTSKSSSRNRKTNSDGVPGSTAASDTSSSPTEERRLSSAREQRSKRRLQQPPPAPSRASKKSKTQKQKENVVRIPMLTGTLVLYKGVNQRAEFIRKM